MDEVIGVGFQQGSVVGSKAHKWDRVRSVANGHAMFGPGEQTIVSECSWWLAVAHSNAGCMAAASSATDEVNAAPRR